MKRAAPLLLAVALVTTACARTGYRALDAAQPAWRHLQAGDFPWLLPAYAAALAGDAPAVQQALAAARGRHGGLRWPWYVAESAWVIEAASALEGGAARAW